MLFRKKDAPVSAPVEPDGVEIQEAAADEAAFPILSRPFRPARIKKVRDALAGNDLRYRGPLSYRHLRIIAWAFFLLTVIGSLLSAIIRRAPEPMPVLDTAASGMQSLWQFAVVLFMLANFSVILHAKNGFRPLLLRFGLLGLAVFLGYVLLIYRYAYGTLKLLATSEITYRSLHDLLDKLFEQGFHAFNIFVDLFLCTLLTLFLYHTPKRGFSGKKILIYRLFALLPILYEIGVIVLKILCAFDRIMLPAVFWPFLTTKPPVFFIVFTVLALFIKRRERRFLASGFTRDEYRRYLKTNRNSLQFSIFTAIVFVAAAAVDIALYFLLPRLFGVTDPSANAEAVRTFYYLEQDIGIGSGIVLLAVAPFVLLFSYTRTHKNNLFDILIPVAAIGVTFLFSIELIYQLIRVALPALAGALR